MTRWVAGLAAVALTSFAGLPLRAADDATPIRVGAISSMTGPATWPEASQAAKAVFDRVNAQGGINGHMIEYTSLDDKADPSEATRAARSLVDDKGVVALVGSASLVDCAANATYYAQRNVVAVQGTGIDTNCFHSKNISPVNTGPFNGALVSLYYASQVLHDTKVCAFFDNFPGFGGPYRDTMARYKKLTGNTPVIADFSVGPSDDVTPFVVRAVQAKCNVMFLAGQEQQAIAWLRAMKQQGSTADVVMLTSVYEDVVATSLGAVKPRFYANSEFEPYTNTSAPALHDFITLMKTQNVPVTSFAEGGYLAATIFVDTVKHMKGDITRDSVTAAFRTLKPYASPLVGNPYMFGPGDAHSPNQSSKFVQLVDGKWSVATPQFIQLTKLSTYLPPARRTPGSSGT
jgi:branched-chain amino acid transport system substrate-binding protein